MPVEPIPNNAPQFMPLDDGEESFDSFASSMPETAQGFLDDSTLPPDVRQGTDATTGGIFDASGDAAASDREKRTKRIKMSKKMQKSMDKLKAQTANLPIMWFHQQAVNHPEWELDKEEKDLLTDAIETVFEVLDIEIQIEPVSWTLTSIYWVLSYPIVVFLFLFVSKKAKAQEIVESSSNAE